MEPRLSTFEVLEVLERLDELKASTQDLSAYTNPSTLSLAAPKFPSWQKELLSALIARELDKPAL